VEINESIRIVKVESLIGDNMVYVIQGELMKRLLENVFSTKQPAFVVTPVAVGDFMREFREKFLSTLDQEPAVVHECDRSMLLGIMRDYSITTYDDKVAYLDRVIGRSVFPEVVVAAEKIKGELKV
jgi:hypothetical protein